MVLHGSTWLFLTLGSAAQSPGSARLSLALLDSWIGTVLFFFLLLLWLVYRRGLRLLLLHFNARDTLNGPLLTRQSGTLSRIPLP